MASIAEFPYWENCRAADAPARRNDVLLQIRIKRPGSPAENGCVRRTTTGA